MDRTKALLLAVSGAVLGGTGFAAGYVSGQTPRLNMNETISVDDRVLAAIGEVDSKNALSCSDVAERTNFREETILDALVRLKNDSQVKSINGTQCSNTRWYTGDYIETAMG